MFHVLSLWSPCGFIWSGGGMAIFARRLLWDFAYKISGQMTSLKSAPSNFTYKSVPKTHLTFGTAGEHERALVLV